MTRWTRFAAVLIVWLAVSTLAAQDAESPPPVEVKHLVGPLHLLRCNGNVHMVASVGADGVLLVDTGYADTAKAVKDSIAELTDLPVRIIINTHGDGDHVGANALFAKEAVIIAHPGVRRRMGTYFALPALDVPGVPTLTIEDGITIHFNGDIIRVLPVPGGHTGGDVVVHFSESGVACIGDLAFSETFPNADPARGGDAQRLAEVLRGLTSTLPTDTTLVPGHGGKMTIAQMQTYVEMIEGTLTAVRSEVGAGRSLAQIVERQPLEPWAKWEAPDIGLSFESWIAELYAAITGDYRRSICAPMTEQLVKHGIDAAVATYRRLKAEEPESWNLGERQLNFLGYQLLFRDMVDEAIVILQLNVDAYPEGFNTYDSLGEAYMTAGKTELAIVNYERSLELNPENTNATSMLARLQGE